MLSRKQIFHTTLSLCLSVMITACSSNEEKRSPDTDKSSRSKTAVSHSSEATATAKSSSQNVRTFSSVNPTEAFQMLQTRKDILFLDVRTLRERAQVFIPGSQYISISSIFKGTVTLP